MGSIALRRFIHSAAFISEANMWALGWVHANTVEHCLALLRSIERYVSLACVV
jgi:hypothetical protein